MRVVAADALALVEGLPRGSRRARVLVAERDVVMDVVADRLHAAGAGGRLPNSSQAMSGQPIGLAVSAAEQEDERLFGKVLDRVLLLRQARPDRARPCRSRAQWPTAGAGPPARRSGCTSCQSRRGRASSGRTGRSIMRSGTTMSPARVVMDVQHQHHRRRLRTVVDEFVANANLHRSQTGHGRAGPRVKRGVDVRHVVRNDR